MTSSLSAVSEKAQLRREALARRDALAAAERQEAAQAIAERGLPFALSRGAVVSGYSPIRSELNPIPLMRRLADQGAILALPRVVGRGQPLSMRIWAAGVPLARGVWGIPEPSAEAAEAEPDVLLIPLAAFDWRGGRIGYGAGYYDLTLRALRAKKPIVAVGIAFAAQEIQRVPATERDESLDLVLTERAVIDCRGAE